MMSSLGALTQVYMLTLNRAKSRCQVCAKFFRCESSTRHTQPDQLHVSLYKQSTKLASNEVFTRLPLSLWNNTWCISVRLEDCKYFLRIYVGCLLKHTLNIKCVASVGVEQGCQTQFTWRYIYRDT